MRFFRPPRVLSVHWALPLHTVQRLLNVAEPTNRDITTSPTFAQLDPRKRQVPSRLGVTALVGGSRVRYRIVWGSRLRPLAAMAIRPRATMTPPTRAARPSSRPVRGSWAGATAGAAAGAAAGLVMTSARTSASGLAVVGVVGGTTTAA